MMNSKKEPIQQAIKILLNYLLNDHQQEISELRNKNKNQLANDDEVVPDSSNTLAENNLS